MMPVRHRLAAAAPARPLFAWLAAVLLVLAAAPARAQQGFSGSGFMTLAVNKMLQGRHDPAADNGFHCPCYTTDYAQAAVVEAGGLHAVADSKLGLQGSWVASDERLRLTGQVVLRGAQGNHGRLEWLYAAYDLTPDLSVQLGRQRLPLLQLSQAQDVGFSLPWVRPPSYVYGWDVVNFNGASLRSRHAVGAWTAEVEAFTGQETVHDSPYLRFQFGLDTRSTVRWPHIVGAALRLQNGTLEARVMAMQSGTQVRYDSSGDTAFAPDLRQRFTSATLAYDDGRWLARTELIHIDRRRDYGTERAAYVGAGRRWERWQLFASVEVYRPHQLEAYVAAGNTTELADVWALVLKRELDTDSAIKLQWDRRRDRSAPGVSFPSGDAQVLTLAYERVF